MPSPKGSSSPSTIKENTMSFPKVIDGLKSGSKYTRLDSKWEDGKYYIYLDTYLMIHKPDGDYVLTVSEADITAEDWVKLNA